MQHLSRMTSVQARLSHQAPAFDSDAVRELLQQARGASYVQQLHALRQVSCMLEKEEAAFRQLVGDPFATPNQRAGFTIGKLLAVVKENEDIYDRIADGWVMAQGATIEQQVEGARFLLAVLTCWQFEYPLTEEVFVQDIQRWAAEYGDKTPAPGDDPPKDEAALLVEERSVYATGLLAASLSNLDYVEAQVKGPLMTMVSKYLRRVVLSIGQDSPQDPRQQQQQQQQQGRAEAEPSVGAGAGGGGGGSGAVTEAEPGAGVGSRGGPADLAQRALKLRQDRVRYCIQIVSRTGEFVESLGPVLQERGVEVQLALLRHCCLPCWPRALAILGEPLPLLMHEVLEMLCALLAHRRFAEQFVEQGGAGVLLQLPRDVHTYSGLSQAFFGLATMPLAFERMCSQPITSPLVSAALSLLGCGFDQARKRAAMFFAACIHYWAVLDEFDAQQGPRRLLNALRALVAQLRSTQLQDLRMERQVCFHCCLALQQWLRAHLALQVQRLRRSLSSTGAAQAVQDHASYKPIDVSNEALDSLVSALDTDRRLAEVFARARWPALESLVDQGGLPVLLELVQYSPQERWFHEITLSALEMLHLATLAPFTRRLVVGTLLSNQRPGMAVLLWAATPPSSAFLNHDPEMVASALQVVSNCIAAPPSLVPLLSSTTSGAPSREAVASAPQGPSWTPALWKAPGGSSPPAVPLAPAPAPPALDLGPSAMPSINHALEQAYTYARQCLRANNGIRVLIQLLQPGSALGGMRRSGLAAGNAATAGPVGGRPDGPGNGSMSGAVSEKIRALSARGLLGLARDPHIRHILAKLQVGRLLAEMVRDPLTACEAGRHASGHAMTTSTGSAATGRADGSVHGAGGAGSSGAGPSSTALVVPLPRQAWHEVFNRSALELIALTATNAAAGRPDRIATAATDTAGTALHKIERAAIAAATPISYSPQELLLLVHEHLRASGLHASAAALAREAGLARVSAKMASAAALLHTPMPLGAAQQALAAGMGQQAGGSTGPATGAGAEAATGTAALVAAGAAMLCNTSQLANAVVHTPLPSHKGGAGAATATGGGALASAATLGAALPTTAGATARKKGLGFSANVLQGALAGGAAAGATAGAGAGTATSCLGPGTSLSATPCTSAAPSGSQQDARTGLGHGGSAQGSDSDLQLLALNGAAVAEGADSGTPRIGVAAAASSAPAPHAGAAGATTGTKRRASGAPTATPPVAPALRTASRGGAAGITLTPVLACAPPLHTPTALPGGAATTAAGQDAGPDAMQMDGTDGAFGDPFGLLPTAFDGTGFGSAAAALHTPMPPLARNRPSMGVAAEPGPLAAAAAGAGVGGGPAAVNPLLLDLPVRRIPTQAGAGAASGSGTAAAASGFVSLGRRLSGTFTSASTTPAAADAPRSSSAAAPSASAAPPLQRSSSLEAPGAAAAAPSSSAHAPASPTQGPPVLPPEPPELPRHLEAAIREVRALAGPPAQSKLHSIVMSYLKQQHRQACMQAAAPTATLPPIPLSKPYMLPQASRALDAPVNCTRRLANRELDGVAGGTGGMRAQRQFVYSRFRQVQSVRDDSSVATCVAFVGGSDIVAAGSHTGEIRMIDAGAGEVMDVVDAHSTAVVLLRAHDTDDTSLLLSSSRHEVKLWPGMAMSRGPVVTWEQATRGRFNNAGTQIAAVSCGGTPRQAYIYDVTSHLRVATLDESGSIAGSPSPIRAERSSRGVLSTAWGPSDDLLLWGSTLWDLRMPKAIHQFDQFTEGASGCFHPRCQEVILNSEVWDLRTFKLLRSVPSLDNTIVTFSGAGDALYCIPRRPGDGELSLGYLHQRTRARHPLHTAFRTLDATTYAEISTIDVERSVLDLAVEPTDWMICLATLDVADAAAMSSSVRIYEVGRRKALTGTGDSDDDEDDDGAEEESEEDEGMESDMESLLASGSDGEGASPADVRRRVLAAAREAGAAAGRALRALANGTEGNDIGDAPGRGDGSGDDDEFEEDDSLGPDDDDEELALRYGLAAGGSDDPYDPELALALGVGGEGLDDEEELDVDAELEELDELEEELMGEEELEEGEDEDMFDDEEGDDSGDEDEEDGSDAAPVGQGAAGQRRQRQRLLRRGGIQLGRRRR